MADSESKAHEQLRLEAIETCKHLNRNFRVPFQNTYILLGDVYGCMNIIKTSPDIEDLSDPYFVERISAYQQDAFRMMDEFKDKVKDPRERLLQHFLTGLSLFARSFMFEVQTFMSAPNKERLESAMVFSGLAERCANLCSSFSLILHESMVLRLKGHFDEENNGYHRASQRQKDWKASAIPPQHLAKDLPTMMHN